MSSKLTAGILAFVASLLAVTACRRPQGIKDGVYVTRNLLYCHSTTQIEELLGIPAAAAHKREVSAGGARFVFYQVFPIREVGVSCVYSYEEMGADEWMLRGCFTLQSAYSRSNAAVVSIFPDYVVEGDSVKIVCYTNAVVTLKSMAPKTLRARVGS
jgi:hypothetical protein